MNAQYARIEPVDAEAAWDAYYARYDTPAERVKVADGMMDYIPLPDANIKDWVEARDAARVFVNALSPVAFIALARSFTYTETPSFEQWSEPEGRDVP